MGPLDPLHLVLATLFLTIAVLYYKSALKTSALAHQIKTLRMDLGRSRSEPTKWEYRMERMELIWYPTVTASPLTKRIESIAPGVPHCKKCILPLGVGTGNSEWVCKKCGSNFPESIVDTVITDGIAKQALDFFKERHEGYADPR